MFLATELHARFCPVAMQVEVLPQAVAPVLNSLARLGGGKRLYHPDYEFVIADWI